MKFMVIVKATPESEAGKMPGDELMNAMGRYNEELVKAGVMLAGEGLAPSSQGARIRYSGGKLSVIDGPFAETKELVAGFWIWDVRDLDEAIAWAKKMPYDTEGEEVEIRKVFEVSDFLDAGIDPELMEREEELRRTVEARQKD